MKRFSLIVPLLMVVIGSVMNACSSTSNETPVPEFASDSIDAYARLLPNEEPARGCLTYGPDSVPGDTIHYRMASDSSTICVDYDITLLELNPGITADIMSFVDGQLTNLSLISEGDSVSPSEVKDLKEKALTQQDFCRTILDRENASFDRQVPNLLADGYTCSLSIKIYPVYLDDKYVTYNEAAYYYLGGANANSSSLFLTYDRTTGEKLNTEDIIKSEKMETFSENVAKHMAAKYPIGSPDSVEAYLDSLNNWLGATADMGESNATETDAKASIITMKNYPVSNPAILAPGVVIVYEKYQLAPGNFGCPIIILPYDEIKDCLKEPFSSL